MSKAFTKESDGNDEDLGPEESAPALPAGTKNYITPLGEKKLRQELSHLLTTARPELTRVIQWAASNGDRSENADYIYGKRRLREIDRRIRFLEKRLEAAEVVDPAGQTHTAVRFGATVTVAKEDGSEATYAIVGVDEIDVKKGRISWVSPLARVLLGATVGDSVTLHSPKGEEDLEILQIKYVAITDDP